MVKRRVEASCLAALALRNSERRGGRDSHPRVLDPAGPGRPRRQRLGKLAVERVREQPLGLAPWLWTGACGGALVGPWGLDVGTGDRRCLPVTTCGMAQLRSARARSVERSAATVTGRGVLGPPLGLLRVSVPPFRTSAASRRRRAAAATSASSRSPMTSVRPGPRRSRAVRNSRGSGLPYHLRGVRPDARLDRREDRTGARPQAGRGWGRSGRVRPPGRSAPFLTASEASLRSSVVEVLGLRPPSPPPRGPPGRSRS